MICPPAVLTRTCGPGAALFMALPSADIEKPAPPVTTRTVWPITTAPAPRSMSVRSGRPAASRDSVTAPTACGGSVTMGLGAGGGAAVAGNQVGGAQHFAGRNSARGEVIRGHHRDACLQVERPRPLAGAAYADGGTAPEARACGQERFERRACCEAARMESPSCVS